MFDVTNWVACLNGENGPGGTPSHEALSVSPQGALEIASVAGQPPSLDRYDFCTPRLVAEPLKCDDRRRPSSQRPLEIFKLMLQKPAQVQSVVKRKWTFFLPYKCKHCYYTSLNILYHAIAPFSDKNSNPPNMSLIHFCMYTLHFS